MGGPAVGVLSPAIEHAAAGADVEQLVQAQRIVQRQRRVGLQLAGALAARIVQGQAGAHRRTLLPVDPQVALPWRGAFAVCGCDLDVSSDGGDALQVLQPLLDVAQIQQAATADRQRIGDGRVPPIRLGEHRVAESPGHHRQGQRAGIQILRCRQHAGGDIAPGDDRVLYALHHHVDALGAQAASAGRIICGVGRGQRPLEARRVLTLQHDVVHAYAGLFLRRQTIAPHVSAALKAHVGPAFLLLAQDAFTLLLAQQFLRARIVPLLGGHIEGHAKQHQPSTTMARMPPLPLP